MPLQLQDLESTREAQRHCRLIKAQQEQLREVLSGAPADRVFA